MNFVVCLFLLFLFWLFIVQLSSENKIYLHPCSQYLNFLNEIERTTLICDHF